MAAALAAELRRPLISRDRLKEGALQTLGFGAADDPGLARRVTDLFFAEIELLLREDVSLVAEAAFQHKVWAPRLAPLPQIADVRMVVCEVPAEVAIEHKKERALRNPLWSRMHPAPEGWESRPEPHEPPALDVPTLKVDTSGPQASLVDSLIKFLG